METLLRKRLPAAPRPGRAAGRCLEVEKGGGSWGHTAPSPALTGVPASGAACPEQGTLYWGVVMRDTCDAQQHFGENTGKNMGKKKKQKKTNFARYNKKTPLGETCGQHRTEIGAVCSWGPGTGRTALPRGGMLLLGKDV